MATVDARGLVEQLKSNQISNLYYLYGSDVLQVEQCTKKILKKLTGETDSDAVTKLNGQNLNLSELADEAELCPMFAEYNCILIHDCNLESLREDARKQLMEIVASLPDSTVLIFYITGFDIYGGKTGKNKKPTPKNKTLADYAAKHGTACCLETKTPAVMATEIIAAAKKRGCDMERGAAQLLAVQCGCQSLAVSQELGKLCAFADGGMITEALVRDMVVPQLETTVYALTKAVIRRKQADAMRAVDELLSLRVEMPYLMATLSGCFIDLQRAAAAKISGKTTQDMTSDFAYRFGFHVDNAFQDSTGRTVESISACLKLLCDAEKRLHSEAVNERVLFEQTIVRMLQQS